MEYDTAVKKKELLPFVTAWMDLEIINAKSNKPVYERKIPHDLTYMRNLMKKIN